MSIVFGWYIVGLVFAFLFMWYVAANTTLEISTTDAVAIFCVMVLYPIFITWAILLWLWRVLLDIDNQPRQPPRDYWGWGG